jgi:hypothetical protein
MLVALPNKTAVIAASSPGPSGPALDGVPLDCEQRNANKENAKKEKNKEKESRRSFALTAPKWSLAGGAKPCVSRSPVCVRRASETGRQNKSTSEPRM